MINATNWEVLITNKSSMKKDLWVAFDDLTKCTQNHRYMFCLKIGNSANLLIFNLKEVFRIKYGNGLCQ